MAGNVGNAQLTEKQQYSLETALQGHNIILTGQCGTGKTHLLR
jgi:DNA replication protein DnaC